MAEFGGIADSEWQMLAPTMSGVGRWIWDIEGGTCRLDTESRAMLGLGDYPKVIPIGDFFERVHPDDIVAVQTAVDVAKAEQTKYEAEFRMCRLDESVVWVRGSGAFQQTPAGVTVLIGTNVDISDLRSAKEAAALIAQEQGHRIGNILALVSGLFRMAARKADDIPSLEDAFIRRLDALRKVTALTLASHDGQVSVTDLAKTVVVEVAGDRLTLKVDEIALNAPAAQTVTLALNELVTNAVKHGALSHQDGNVYLNIVADKERDIFAIDWRETTPFEISEPKGERGFGMTVLRRMTATTFRGEPKLNWKPDGLNFHCTWSLAAMTPDDADWKAECEDRQTGHSGHRVSRQ